MIHNKSSHPVEVKKISIRMWTLRDEIEAAIESRIKECEALEIPVYVEDIKKFYDIKDESSNNVVPFLNPTSSADEAMAAMLEALDNGAEPAKKINIDELSGALDQSEVDAMLAAMMGGGPAQTEEPAKKINIDELAGALNQAEVDAMMAAMMGGGMTEEAPPAAVAPEASPAEGATPKAMTPDEAMELMLADLDKQEAEQKASANPTVSDQVDAMLQGAVAPEAEAAPAMKKSAADEAMDAIMADLEKSEAAPAEKKSAADEAMDAIMADLEKSEAAAPTMKKSAADEAMEAMLAELDNEEQTVKTAPVIEKVKPNPFLENPYTKKQVPDLDKMSYGFVLLSDVHMESMLGFIKEKFLHGQTVTVEFLIPQSFQLTASINYCHHYAMRSRIISSTKPDYRVQCKFKFSFLGERNNLRTLLKSVEPTISNEKKPKKENKNPSISF